MNIWEKQPDETSKARAAFSVYLDLGADRSLDKAYRVARGLPEDSKKRAPNMWRSWSSRHDWPSRAAAYDDHLEQQARAAYEAEWIARYQALREDEWDMSQALFDVAMRELKAPPGESTMSVSEAGRVAMLASKIGRLAVGEPTKYTSTEQRTMVKMSYEEQRRNELEAMSDEELRAYKVGLARAILAGNSIYEEDQQAS